MTDTKALLELAARCEDRSVADALRELAERIAFLLSCGRVRDCYRSLMGGVDEWTIKPTGEVHGGSPYYQMGFYPDDRNLYYARGWGRHVKTWPWERWLLRRAALRALAQEQSK